MDHGIVDFPFTLWLTKYTKGEEKAIGIINPAAGGPPRGVC